jgi:hypothetical protein
MNTKNNQQALWTKTIFLLAKFVGENVSCFGPQKAHLTCPGHLGQYGTNRITSICAVSPKVVKVSTVV